MNMMLSLTSLTWGNELKLYQLVWLRFGLLRLNFLLKLIGLSCCIAKMCGNKDIVITYCRAKSNNNAIYLAFRAV